MNYITVPTIINNTLTKVSVLEGPASIFTNVDGILDYDKYNNHIQQHVNVSVSYQDGKDKDDNPVMKTRNENMSRELALKMTENGQFNSNRYISYMARCENLIR